MKKNVITVAQLLQLEKLREQMKKELREQNPEMPYIELLAIMRDAEKKAMDEGEKLKKLTKKEERELTANVKTQRANLLALPPPPHQKIIPAPGISHMNASELYLYVSPRYVNILALPEMATCNPTVAFVKAISDALYPYAVQNGRKMSEADLETRDTLTAQCKEQFLLMMQSCAILAGGNKALFLLTGVACKRKGTKRNIQSTPPNFRIETTKGSGRLLIIIDKVEFAENYTIFFGPGAYDKATWDSVTGQSRQIIEGLTPGAAINVIVRANGKSGSATDNSMPQGRNVPFN